MRHKSVCGIEIAYDRSGRTFPLSPRGVKLVKEENKPMKVVQKTLLTFLMVVGLSLAVSAQKDGGPKKPQPKPSPPVVTPQPKPPPDSNKPKKPGMAFFGFVSVGKLEVSRRDI